MSVRDFPPRPQGATPDSVPYQNWLDALGQRQNIDLLQELTTVNNADEVAIFDASETGQNKTKKITVANLLAGAGGGIARGTPVATTSGTTVTVATGISAGVSVVELALSAISTNGSSAILVQIGDSGGFETTGYASSAWQGGSSDTLLTSTAGFLCNTGSNSSLNVSGVVLLRRGTGNLWTFGGTTARSDGAGYCLGGTKTLSDELTQIRITMVNGTDTFDAGEITPFY